MSFGLAAFSVFFSSILRLFAAFSAATAVLADSSASFAATVLQWLILAEATTINPQTTPVVICAIILFVRPVVKCVEILCMHPQSGCRGENLEC